MAIKHSITLSTTEPNNEVGVIKIRQADEQTQTLEVQITENGVPKSYQGLAVYFCAKLGQTAGLGIIEQKLKPEEMTNPANGKLEYTMRAEDWQTLGRQRGYFSFRKMKDEHEFVEQFTTRDFTFDVIKSVYSDGLKEVKKDGSTYVWTIEDLIRLFNEYMASGKSDWEEFVEQNREVLESVDPGGKLIGELIDARRPFGSDAYATLGERLDESDAQLAQNVTQATLKNQATNVRNKKDLFYGMSSKNLIGDSITQGFNSTNFLDNSWAGIMRKLINLEFGTDNIGFVSFSTSNTDYQTLDYTTGNWSERATSDGTYLGLMKWTSTDATSIFKVTPKVEQTMASICYEAQVGGGQLDVYVNGGLRFTIDTSIAPYGKNRKSDVFNITKDSLIELRKKDTNITTFSGIWYSKESQATSNCMFNNYARSGAKLVDIDNAVLNVMCDADIVFFALGHNDCYSRTVTIEQFKAKIDYVRDRINANGSMLVVLDFIWKHQPTNEFRKELLRLANECKGIYIEPAKMFNFDNTIMISKGFFASSADTSHPTDYGHKFIAEQTAKSVGLSNSTKYATASLSTPATEAWHYVGGSGEPAFQNSWANVLTTDKYKTKFKKINGVVFIEIWASGGANNTVIFTLPTGYRPNLTIMRPTFVDGSTTTSINMKNAVISESGTITLKENYASGEFKAQIEFAI